MQIDAIVPNKPAAPRALHSRGLVLIVDDEPANRLLLRDPLEVHGYEIIEAENGEQAVALFPEADWDIVLMDMQMPVMGGLEATRLIRALEAQGRHTPIIAMTANAMEADRQACVDAGMDEHLAKPFKSTVLQDLLQRFSTV